MQNREKLTMIFLLVITTAIALCVAYHFFRLYQMTKAENRELIAYAKKRDIDLIAIDENKRVSPKTD